MYLFYARIYCMLHRSARYNITVRVSQFEDRNHVGFFSSFKFLTFSKGRVLNRLSVIAGSTRLNKQFAISSCCNIKIAKPDPMWGVSAHGDFRLLGSAGKS